MQINIKMDIKKNSEFFTPAENPLEICPNKHKYFNDDE